MATRITRLIGEIQREPFTGIGKPEPLKGDLSGYWSRRIDDEHRLVYRADEKEVKILKARYHYSGRGADAVKLTPLAFDDRDQPRHVIIAARHDRQTSPLAVTRTAPRYQAACLCQ
jgi:toxin YoeB